MIQSNLNKTHLTFKLRYAFICVILQIKGRSRVRRILNIQYPILNMKPQNIEEIQIKCFFISQQANMIKLPNETEEF